MKAWRAAAVMVLFAAAYKIATAADSTAPQPLAAMAIPWQGPAREDSPEPRRHGPTICPAAATPTVARATALAPGAATAVPPTPGRAALAAPAVTTVVRAGTAAVPAAATAAVLADSAGAAVVLMAVAADLAVAVADSTAVAVAADTTKAVLLVGV